MQSVFCCTAVVYQRDLMNCGYDFFTEVFSVHIIAIILLLPAGIVVVAIVNTLNFCSAHVLTQLVGGVIVTSETLHAAALRL